MHAPERIDLKIGFVCNNRCIHCVQGKKRRAFGNKSFATLRLELRKASKLAREIVFTGGEPTIHPHFLQIVGLAKVSGFDHIQIQSNGRMFAYQDFCIKTIEAGGNEFALALHGATPAIHDGLTLAPGSFDQTVTAIRNLKELGQTVVMNTVITRKNYKNLPGIAALLVDLGVDQFQLAFVHPAGSAWENFDEVVPRISKVIPYVKKALDIGIKAKKRVMTEAITPCFLKGYEEYIAEKIIPETMIFDADFVIKEYTRTRQDHGKIKGSHCKGCVYFKMCEGPWREYPQRMGWEEFIPVSVKAAR